MQPIFLLLFQKNYNNIKTISRNSICNQRIYVPVMPRGRLPMFDVVCSRKASGPWETPGIVGIPAGVAVIGWEGPGCGIPIMAGCIAAGLEAAAAGPIGDPPIAGAEGLRFNINCQC